MNPVCELPGQSLTGDSSGFPDPQHDVVAEAQTEQAEAVLAGGCFWCTEAVYRQLDGVLDVISGYAGGTADDANYRAVCSGETNHAEAIRIRYDPRRISYGQLLKVFMSAAHDPTQLDRQGNDRGRQYRSAIFPTTAAERDVARAYIAQLDAAGVFKTPIVTTLERLVEFYPAEAHHQDYAARNPEQGYIAAVSAPKVAKVRKLFAARLKPGVG
jgi:peptide-methionine (S)-S-oxide reductase